MILLTCDALGHASSCQVNACTGHVSFLVWIYLKGGRPGRGIKEPEPTFSTCFGAPLPRPPDLQEIVGRQIAKGGTACGPLILVGLGAMG